MRTPHWLSPNAKNELPSYCLFYDTETKPRAVGNGETVQELVLGWTAFAYRHNSKGWFAPTYKRFDSVEAFWDIVFSRTADKRKLYVFAHNQGFDFTVVRGFKILREHGWKIKKAIIEGPPTIITFRKGKRTICILCTLNYFRTSLKALGEAIGVKKAAAPTVMRNDDETSEYCKQDVTVILEAMKSFINLVSEWDLGNFQPTLAGQSFAAYRHRFMESPIFIDSNPKALEIARKAYAGGRTETFYVGKIKQTLHLLDINSQYPHVMREHEYPTKLIGVYHFPTDTEIRKWVTKYAVCAHVRVKTDVAAFPMRHDGRLIFPVGVFDCYLSTPEIQYLIDNGIPFKIFGCAVYQKAQLFRKFVDYFYEKRTEFRAVGNEPFAYMCKILMNSLYGKWGQSGRVYDEAGRTADMETKAWIEIDVETGEKSKLRQFNGVIQRLTGLREGRDSHPAIAAHVTAQARMLLFGLMRRAGYSNVFYVDTDSLLVTSKGLRLLQRFIHPSALGALKLEATFTSGHIYGPKDYQLDEKVRIKGVRSNALHISNNVYEQDTFVGFKGMIRAGDLDHMVIRRTTKVLQREYKKGIVGAGGRVMPIRFP